MTPQESAMFFKFSTYGMPRPESRAYMQSLLDSGVLWQLPTAYLDLAAQLLYPEGNVYNLN